MNHGSGGRRSRDVAEKWGFDPRPCTQSPGACRPYSMASTASNADKRDGPRGYIKGSLCAPNLPTPLPPIRTPPIPARAKMRNFPQELVDLVIDKLAEDPGPGGQFEPVPTMSKYSTVSRKWTAGTQKHHFNSIYFFCQDGVEKWRTAIKADPLGVSRHVCRLELENINTLLGFEDHIRALTNVRKVVLFSCDITLSLPDTKIFALMGSNLAELYIHGADTRPHIMASLLAGLPRLRKLHTRGVAVEPDPSPAALSPNIPFFEDAGYFDLDLHMKDYLPEALNWIPPTARFHELRMDASYITPNSELVNNWLASSGDSLQRLTIRGYQWGTSFASLARHNFQPPPSDCKISLKASLSDPWTSRGVQP
jgi:hypothetical protein